jgi:hypothetical protein
MYFHGRLQDSDKDQITADLEQLSRSLHPHLENAYEEGCRCRLMRVNADTGQSNLGK